MPERRGGKLPNRFPGLFFFPPPDYMIFPISGRHPACKIVSGTLRIVPERRLASSTYSYTCMLRILIADDNVIFRRALRDLLERADHWQVTEAGDGQEAVRRSVETRPDVIFLDLAMPGKDGLAAAQEISTLLPETPIVMCTMHLSRHLEAEARKHGIRKVITKTEADAMVPAVRQLLNQPTASQALAGEPMSPTAGPGTDAVSATPKNVD